MFVCVPGWVDQVQHHQHLLGVFSDACSSQCTQVAGCNSKHWHVQMYGWQHSWRGGLAAAQGRQQGGALGHRQDPMGLEPHDKWRGGRSLKEHLCISCCMYTPPAAGAGMNTSGRHHVQQFVSCAGMPVSCTRLEWRPAGALLCWFLFPCVMGWQAGSCSVWGPPTACWLHTGMQTLPSACVPALPGICAAVCKASTWQIHLQRVLGSLRRCGVAGCGPLDWELCAAGAVAAALCTLPAA